MPLSKIDSSSINGLGYGFKNRIINGDMRIDQRNAGASITPASGNAYIVDRFRYTTTQASKITCQRSTTASVGFVNSISALVASAFSSTSTDYFGIEQLIEGFNVSDLGWGTASAQSVTLSFSVRSSVTGTYALRFTNDVSNRSYVATFTVNAANTFEQKSITVAGDTSGTWQTDNRTGLAVWFDMGSGSNFNTTAGAWSAGNYTRTSGAVSFVANAGATFYITGVQLEKGSTATSFDYRPYGTELALCQRYYEKSYNDGVAVASATLVGRLGADGNSAGRWYPSVGFRVSKRSSPTMVAYSDATGASGNITVNGSNTAYTFGSNIGMNGGLGTLVSSTSNAIYACQWTAESEL